MTNDAPEYAETMPEAERMFRAGLRYGADVLEQNKRESDPGTFTAGVEACVEVLRALADGRAPAMTTTTDRATEARRELEGASARPRCWLHRWQHVQFIGLAFLVEHQRCEKCGRERCVQVVP